MMMMMMMTATKETTLAISFIMILTVITTMTMNDDVLQGRSVITESLLNHSFALVSEACDCTTCKWKAMRAVRYERLIDGEVPLPERFVDVIICEEWSLISCPIGSALGDLRRVSEYSVL